MASVAKNVMRVGRATVFLVGLAVILALVFGVATSALGANGKPFLLGKGNVATKVSTLVKKGAGPALSLRVGAGQPPLAVNSAGKVANLNSDQLDGKDSSGFYAAGSKVADSSHADQADSATDAQNASTVDGKSASEIGINGLEQVTTSSALNSSSSKHMLTSCPAGKVVVGTGASIDFGTKGNFPNEEADVVLSGVTPISSTTMRASASEEEPTNAIWQVHATAICATAP